MFDWIVQLIGRGGYAGIALMMFLENIFPPIPSWLVMPLAGFEASSGRFSPVLVVISGTIGSTAGAVCWYWLGRLVGLDRLRGAGRWFDRHGAPAVMFGRVVPIVRILISLPAGLFRLRLRRFVLFTAIGDTVWNGALTAAGYALRSRYADVADYMNPAAGIMLTLVATVYVARAFGRRKDR
jgi:membrane protein DedA with SNARE-associated domain